MRIAKPKENHQKLLWLWSMNKKSIVHRKKFASAMKIRERLEARFYPRTSRCGDLIIAQHFILLFFAHLQESVFLKHQKLYDVMWTFFPGIINSCMLIAVIYFDVTAKHSFVFAFWEAWQELLLECDIQIDKNVCAEH